MAFKNFRFNIIIRVLVLCLTFYAVVALAARTQLFATTLVLGIAIVMQVISLIRYLETTNRKLTRFLQSIQYSDFSQSYSRETLGSSFQELNEAFNSVMEKFRQARGEKEEQYRYLQTVVQHVGIGLMAFKNNGEIDFFNNALKRLLDIRRLKHLDDLAQVDEALPEKIKSLKSNERGLVKIQRDDQILNLVINVTDFTKQEDIYRLVSLQNIQTELEETEMEAWQKLIRVLTHEIMNSVTPISSLASTANVLLNGCDLDNPEEFDETKEDIQSAMQTIERRSKSLMHFVENYRKLTRIPKPDFQTIHLQELINRLVLLMQQKIDERQVRLNTDINPSNLELIADPVLVEQVLINLFNNALDATQEVPEPEISLGGKLSEQGRVVLSVSDNGPGISKDIQERIFIPFFTTKPSGSGIGLALSRQIMRLHGGSISVQSQPGNTVFGLKF